MDNLNYSFTFKDKIYDITFYKIEYFRLCLSY